MIQTEVRGDLRFDWAFDRGARNLAITLRRVTIASGEERIVDRDRKE